MTRHLDGPDPMNPGTRVNVAVDCAYAEGWRAAMERAAEVPDAWAREERVAFRKALEVGAPEAVALAHDAEASCYEEIATAIRALKDKPDV